MKANTLPLKDRRTSIREMLSKAFSQECMVKVMQWRNSDSNRYYSLFAGTDLFGDRIIERHWGSSKTKQGQVMRNFVKDEEELNSMITKIDGLMQRRDLHGYEVIEA